MKSVVGLFSSVAEANQVKSALQAQGLQAGRITVIDQAAGSSGVGQDGSLVEKVKNFFTGFSEHQDEHDQYATRIGQGGALLSVSVADEEAEGTADLLQSYGAKGIQGGEESLAAGTNEAVPARNTDLRDETSITGEQVIPVVQEELVVGKRAVERGGVRIYSHVVEEPATAEVALHNERVVVDRRSVDRPATEADFATGAGVVELTAKGEEAVVGKSSRVVEEVRVGKQASEHTEQVTDTVRRSEIEIEPTTVTTTKGGKRF